MAADPPIMLATTGWGMPSILLCWETFTWLGLGQWNCERQFNPQGGRPRLSDRAGLAGIIFVLCSGIPWRMLPKELGCGSGSNYFISRDPGNWIEL